MVSLATERLLTLKQGNCKNAYCQDILPDDEFTIGKPPIRDPDATKNKYWLLKWTLHGLQCSSHHWYTKINAALNQIGLQANSLEPCLDTGHIIDPSNPGAPPSTSLLTLSLYVDDFIYLLEGPKIKRHFNFSLSLFITVDFMGTVEWFLGTYFQLNKLDNKVSVHLSQTGFVAHLVEDKNTHLCNITPDTTLYYSGLPIDAIPESDNDNNSPAFIECKRKYQSVVGSIGLLASST
jgi:hypothetical protein